MENTSQDLTKMTYCFVGLGLMGGSMAKAIKKYILNTDKCSGKILATTRKESSLVDAKNQKIIDDYKLLSDISGVKELLAKSDITFVCLPPKATIQFLIDYKDFFKTDSIVTEIAGVKDGIFKAFPQGIENVNFIPGHPMAGNEREGFDFSDSEIFHGRNYIFMPYKTTQVQALETFQNAMRKIGFTNLILTDAKTHDHKIAFTSQLCHVIASSLVDCAEDTKITQFGGGSFEDLTRIALINAPLWSELFILNKAELVAHIENFENSLNKIKTQIQNEDKVELEKTLSSVREKRAQMAKYQKS